MTFAVLDELNWLAVLVAGVASALVVTGFFDPKKPQPMVWVAITSGYHVVGFVVVATIVSAWT